MAILACKQISFNSFKNEITYKSWRQHPTRHQLYGHLSKLDELDMLDTAGEAGTSS